MDIIVIRKKTNYWKGVEQEMNKHFLSIVIPVFNVGKYINKTLESLESQTLKDFEVIIINDGSTDSSKDIIKEWSNKLNIRYYEQENMGVSNARNKGIALAKGEYIYFLDGDDFIAPSTVKQLNKAMLDNYDFIYFKYNTQNSEHNIIGRYDDKFSVLTHETKNIEILNAYLKRVIHINMCSFIIKKEILLNNSIYFEEGCINGEDQEFIIKAITCSKRLIGINEVLFYYVKRSSSISNSFNVKRFQVISAYERIKDYLSKNSLYASYRIIEEELEIKEFYYLLRNYLIKMPKKKSKDVYKEIYELTKVPEKKIFIKLILNYGKYLRVDRIGEIIIMWKLPVLYGKIVRILKEIREAFYR